MKETIIINLIHPAIAELTKTYLARQYSDLTFEVRQYYSEFIHVVTYNEVSKERLLEIQIYARGVSDVLGKLT